NRCSSETPLNRWVDSSTFFFYYRLYLSVQLLHASFYSSSKKYKHIFYLYPVQIIYITGIGRAQFKNTNYFVFIKEGCNKNIPQSLFSLFFFYRSASLIVVNIFNNCCSTASFCLI